MTSEETIELTDKIRKNKNLFQGIIKGRNLLLCLISCFYQKKHGVFGGNQYLLGETTYLIINRIEIQNSAF